MHYTMHRMSQNRFLGHLRDQGEAIVIKTSWAKQQEFYALYEWVVGDSSGSNVLDWHLSMLLSVGERGVGGYDNGVF